MSLLKNIFKDESVTVKGIRAYGRYRNYPVAAEQSNRDNSMIIKFFIHIEHEHKNDLYEALRSTEERLKHQVKNFKGIQSDGKTVLISLGRVGAVHAANNAKTVIQDVITVIQNNMCSPGCECCGEYVGTNFYNFGNTIKCLCPACYEEVKSQTATTDKTKREVKVNYPLGILGAIGGVLISAFIYMLLLRFGRIMMSIFLPILPFVGYHTFGKRIDKLGAIITTVLCIVVFFLATRFGLCWFISAQTDGLLSVTDVNGMLDELVKTYKEFKDAYTECMVKGFGLSALMSVIVGLITFFDKGVTNIQKLD